MEARVQIFENPHDAAAAAAASAATSDLIYECAVEALVRIETIREDAMDAAVSAVLEVERLRRKRRRKRTLYISLVVSFQIAIILPFALTIMRIRTPKFRLTSTSPTSVTYSSSTTDSSFNIRINIEFRIRNTNFGRYKFQQGDVSFCYNGELVGSACIPNSSAGGRSSKTIGAVVDLTSARLPKRPELGADLSSGVLLLNARARLNGEVEVLGVLKRKKSVELDCVIVINLRQGIVGDLRCN